MPIDYEAAKYIVEQNNGWGINLEYALSLLWARANGVPTEELNTEGLTSTNRSKILSYIEAALPAEDNGQPV